MADMGAQVRQPRKNRVRLTVTLLCGAILGMTGLVWASVPLYQLFCQVTGFAGTTRVAEREADEVVDRVVKVRFNADIASDLPWTFRPSQRELKVRLGETGMAYYTAVNTSEQPTVGTATYNVTPAKAGPYFSKIECFCFTEQALAPGEKAEFPVTFYVDPEMVDDRNLDEIKTITLSYMFFEKPPARQQPAGRGSDNAITVAHLDPGPLGGLD